ncbi:MAG: azurin [Actinobacteria bacterium]|nr:MAG: azurin [Actinomycetota bacterium]
MRHPARLLAVVLIAASGVASAAARLPAAAPRVIEIKTGDNMKFDPAAITAAPGESVTVVIRHVGQMPKAAMGHNFVLIQKASEAKAIADTCASARDTEFIAPAVKGQLLAFTRLVGPGETAEITFKAPARRGDYLFICTFPGHFAMGMKGTLTVK